MHNLCQPRSPKKSPSQRMMARLLPVSLYMAQIARWNTTMMMTIKRLKNNVIRLFPAVKKDALCQFSDSYFLTAGDDQAARLFGLDEVM